MPARRNARCCCSRASLARSYDLGAALWQVPAEYAVGAEDAGSQHPGSLHDSGSGSAEQARAELDDRHRRHAVVRENSGCFPTGLLRFRHDATSVLRRLLLDSSLMLLGVSGLLAHTGDQIIGVTYGAEPTKLRPSVPKLMSSVGRRGAVIR